MTDRPPPRACPDCGKYSDWGCDPQCGIHSPPAADAPERYESWTKEQKEYYVNLGAPVAEMFRDARRRGYEQESRQRFKEFLRDEWARKSLK